MVDLINALSAAVEKNGLTAVMILVVICGAGFIAYWNTRLIQGVMAATSELRQLSTDTIQRNTVANNDNTASNLKLTSAVNKMVDSWGSDPQKMCKADVAAAAAMAGCKLGEMEIIMRKWMEKEQAKKGD